MTSVAALFDDIPLIQSGLRGLTDGPLLIYGAGNTGKAVAKYLSISNYDVCAFIDKNSAKNSLCDGRSVLSLGEAFDLYGSKTAILIAVHNRGVDMTELVRSIEEAGFVNYYTMFDYVRNFPDDSTFRYFLADPLKLSLEKNNADKFFSLLSDDLSRSIYLDLLKFRLYGDYNACPKPIVENQYSPVDIPRWSNPLRLIDCGAYNGDSIRLFKNYQYEIESVIAFEPDLSNYHDLVKNNECPNGVFLPCGVSNTAKMVQFSSDAGEACRASIDGSITIQMLSIDEAFPGLAPNLIKMDIEGGEREAILGAQATIKKYRPGLAVSAYHLPADLWQLGLLICEIDANYHFYMRSHAYSSFDTVLYAVPK
jgi:FkbM family methyltransferase